MDDEKKMMVSIMAAILFAGANCSTIHEAVEKSKKILTEVDVTWPVK